MQKLVLFALIALALAQNPIPIPLVNLDLSDLNGDWYVPWAFNEVSDASTISCAQLSIATTHDAGSFNLTLTNTAGTSQNQFYNFTVLNTGNTSWEFGGVVWDWVSVDVFDFSWAVFASGQKNAAFLISRNPNVSGLVTYAASLLLQGEGFSVDSDNAATFQNLNCASSFIQSYV